VNSAYIGWFVRIEIVFFLLEHAGDIKRVKEWSNYNEQNLNLDQGEGCRGLMRKLLKKKKETMDLTTPQPANLRFIQLRYWLRGQVSRL